MVHEDLVRLPNGAEVLSIKTYPHESNTMTANTLYIKGFIWRLVMVMFINDKVKK